VLHRAECLSDETVLAFVEGRLESDLADRTHTHMAGCPKCRRLVSEVARSYLEPGADAPFPSRELSQSTAHTVSILLKDRFPPEPVTRLHAGTIISRYRVLETVGVGGMGVVYAADDPQLGRTIALKLMRPDGSIGVGQGTQERLLREARAMARLSHPNVVAVHDAGTFQGTVFVAMELVKGQTLRRWLRAQPRTHAQILDVFAQAGRGLAAAHSVGLVHRDFKPDNVLIGEDGRVRVTDFGLARSMALDEGRPQSTPLEAFPSGLVPEPALTRTGLLVGTPAYMAPEQFAGGAFDARTNQFSFSVVLYEALYGERAFVAEDLTTLAREVTSGRVRDPPDGTNVPGWLREVLLRGLRASPKERFPSMGALLVALTGASQAARTSERPPRLRSVLIAFGTLVMAAGVVLARLQGFPSDRRPSDPDAAGAAMRSPAVTSVRQVVPTAPPPVATVNDAVEGLPPPRSAPKRIERVARPHATRHHAVGRHQPTPASDDRTDDAADDTALKPLHE
jgi:serine/threonine protein kinase